MKVRALRWALPFVLFAVAGVGVAMAMSASHRSRGTVDTARRGSFGVILVAANGRTLYRYTPDRRGKSVCVAACLKFWPALLVKTKPTAGSGVKASLLGTIKAAKGMRQVTYAGYPLYYFVDDKKGGQTKGQGYQKLWYVVAPTGKLVKRAATSTPATTTSTPTSTSSGGGGWG
jgi:predicted lipoprotein with Yx(FWY)xxD motif